MKMINLIHEPDVIERILRHLELWKQHPPPLERKAKVPAHEPVVLEDFDDGWHRYEDRIHRSFRKPLGTLQQAKITQAIRPLNMPVVKL
jgi:hypothetical protein